MKFAFATQKYFPFGGLERDMLRIACCASNRGHDVVIYTTVWQGDLPENSSRIKVEFLSSRCWSNHGRAVEFERVFQNVIREKNFDATVAFNRIGGCDFYFAADNCYAVDMPKKHGKWILKLLPRYRTFLNLERRVFAPESHTKIWYLAQRQKLDFMNSYGTPEDRFFYLPPGIDDRCKLREDRDVIKKSIREKLGIAQDAVVLLQVASNFRLKGGDRSVEAMNNLPENCVLLFAGATGESSAQIRYLGGRTDVPDLLCASDILVHPARNDATGTVIAEAIASGVPVVASEVCGFSDLANSAGSVVLSEPWNQTLFADALVTMIEKLESYRDHAVKYAQRVDYHCRAETAVDLLESYVMYRS